MLPDSKQALLEMDDTEDFTSWMANSKTEIQFRIASLGSLQLLQASLKSAALVQVMAASGCAGRFCRGLPQRLPEEVAIVCRFPNCQRSTGSGQRAELHGSTHVFAIGRKISAQTLPAA